MASQKEIEKRKLELADRISKGQTTHSLLLWYKKEYGIEKTVFYKDYDSILDEVSEKYSEKLKRVAAKYTLILEKAMEGSMQTGQFSLISNQVAVLGKLAGISSEKVEHKHQIEGGFNINIKVEAPKKKIQLIEAEDVTQLSEIVVTNDRPES